MRTTEVVDSQDGTRIAFDRDGSGPPVVLVEPAGQYRDLSAFEGLRPRLAADLTVVAYDRRGRGQSTDAGSYQPAREVEDLLALIDRIGEPVHLYGYSSGALLALHAAAHGLPIRRLALLEPPLQEADAVEHFHHSVGVPVEILDQMRDSATFHKMVVGLFVARERRAAEPVLPLRLFGNSIFTVCNIASFLVGLAMFGVIIFVPLFLQVVNGASPTRSGLLLTPLMLGLIVGTVGSGRLITRCGRYKTFPVAGTAIMAVGIWLLSLFDTGAVQAGPEVIRALPPDVRVQVTDAFADALHVTFLWGIPLAVLAFVVVLFLREEPLRDTAHVGLEAIGEDLGVAFETGFDPGSVPELLSPPAAVVVPDGSG